MGCIVGKQPAEEAEQAAKATREELAPRGAGEAAYSPLFAVIAALTAGAAAFAIDYPNVETAAGVLLGIMAAYAKTRLNTVILLLLVHSTGRRHALKAALFQIGSLALNFIILFVCIHVNLRLFAGCAAGMVLLPALLTVLTVCRKTGR